MREAFGCGHPRTPKNTRIMFGHQATCRTCDDTGRLARAEAAKARTRQRNAEIVQAYDEDEPIAEISLRHSISAKRTMQILIAAGRAPTIGGAGGEDPLYASRAIKVAAKLAGANVPQLLSRWRAPKELVHARWCVMTALRERGLSLPRIGHWLKRDHSTVIYGLGQAAIFQKRSPEFVRMLDEVRAA